MIQTFRLLSSFTNSQTFVSISSSMSLSVKKMELFHSARIYFETMGICDCDAFNWKSLLFLVATFKSAITTGAVIALSKAKNAAENAFAFYQTTNALATTFAILVCIWKKRNIFELIYCFESFIEKSELSCWFWHFWTL